MEIFPEGGDTPPAWFRLSRRAAIPLILALALLGGGLTLLLTTKPEAAGGLGGPFELTDGSGRRVTDQDFRGRYMLVYFGYTFCPDVCPTTLNQVADALDRLGPRADRIAPVVITIDPKRDTPAVIQKYVAAFSPKFVGLTGTSGQIAAVAGEYRVYYAEHRTGNGPEDYTMDHSSILYLMGPDGAFIAPIRADGTGEQIAAELGAHLS